MFDSSYFRDIINCTLISLNDAWYYCKLNVKMISKCGFWFICDCFTFENAKSFNVNVNIGGWSITAIGK